MYNSYIDPDTARCDCLTDMLQINTSLIAIYALIFHKMADCQTLELALFL